MTPPQSSSLRPDSGGASPKRTSIPTRTAVERNLPPLRASRVPHRRRSRRRKRRNRHRRHRSPQQTWGAAAAAAAEKGPPAAAADRIANWHCCCCWRRRPWNWIHHCPTPGLSKCPRSTVQGRGPRRPPWDRRLAGERERVSPRRSRWPLVARRMVEAKDCSEMTNRWRWRPRGHPVPTGRGWAGDDRKDRRPCYRRRTTDKGYASW